MTGEKPGADDSYFERAQKPLASLLFVLPMVAVYEIGTRGVAMADGAPSSEVMALTMLRRFFDLFALNRPMLPALALVAILLSWHVLRRDSWRVRIGTLSGMLAESILLALPLLILGFAVAARVPLATGVAVAGSSEAAWVRWGELFVLSFGAGVYEELVFRLGAMTLVQLIVEDVFRAGHRNAIICSISTSAVVFALYHYWGHEAFEWRSMVFRTLAGIYFSILFVFRGFGITAGCHTAYDIFVVAVRGPIG